MGGVLETEIHKRQAPVWNYLKSRGFYAGVQIDGTVIIERGDENERFYGERISVADILAGKARHPPYEIRTLMATIRAAQGDTVDEASLPASEPTPGDMDIEKPEVAPGFGLPTEDDPDPYGVRALQKIGLEIKEAGTKRRPSMEVFDYKPAPSSPIYGTFRRHSIDSNRRNSKRSSIRSIASVDRGTQTADFESSPIKDKYAESRNGSPTVHTPNDIKEDLDGEKDAATSKEADVIEAVPESAAPILTKARLVTLPKRTPPNLPPRNPQRKLSSAMDGSAAVSSYSSESVEKGTDTHSSSPLKEFVIQYQAQNTEEQHSPEHNIATNPDSRHPSPRPPDGLDNVSHDANRLSPKKDGFDEISVSDSDYSRETPIAMRDNDTGTSTVNNSTLYGKGTNVSEEFHSVPNTPLETRASPFRSGHDAQKSDL